MRLNQGARPRDTPPGGVVVVVTAIRSKPRIRGISRAAHAASRQPHLRIGHLAHWASLVPRSYRLSTVNDNRRGFRKQELLVNLDRAGAHDLAGISRRDLSASLPAESSALFGVERQRLLDRHSKRRRVPRRHEPARDARHDRLARYAVNV